MSEKRYAFVSTMGSHPWGGSEELWSGAAAELVRDGEPVTAVVKHWGRRAAQVDALAAAGIQVLEVGGDGPLSRLAKRLWRRCGLGAGVEVGVLRRAAPDFAVISQGGINDGLAWATACQRQGVPYAIITQAANEGWWPSDDMADAMRSSFHGARRCYFVSEGNRALVERMVGECLPNARVVRNPFTVPCAEILPWPGDSETLRLACVGRLEPDAKGQDLLLKVLAEEAWKARPVKTSFFGEGKCARGVGHLASSLGLRSVEFRGHVADVVGIWREHHVLVLPSRYEGLPLALVEAMLCGRPAIVTDVGGNSEMVEDGTSGFVARCATVSSLAHAMERAWAARENLASMGRAAACRASALVPPHPVNVFVNDLKEVVG